MINLSSIIVQLSGCSALKDLVANSKFIKENSKNKSNLSLGEFIGLCKGMGTRNKNLITLLKEIYKASRQQYKPNLMKKKYFFMENAHYNLRISNLFILSLIDKKHVT